MSYCRFSEGDIYLTQGDKKRWTCFWCKLDPNEKSQTLHSIMDVGAHLKSHEKVGHKVPSHAKYKVREETEWELRY